jgi:uncharacterized protein
MARNAPQIDAYGDGGFRLGGHRHDGSLLILDDVARPWPVVTLAELTPEDLASVLAAPRGQLDFMVLGAGVRNAPPPRAVREAFQAANLGLEMMDTPAAIRLYNLLTSEGRRLACALIAV